MANNPYNLKQKSDAELHQWIAAHKPDTDEYYAGIVESMRRNGAPVRHREWIAIGIAVISIAIVIFLVVTTY